MGAIGRVAGVCLATMLAGGPLCAANLTGGNAAHPAPLQSTDDPLSPPGMSLRQALHTRSSRDEPTEACPNGESDTADTSPRVTSGRRAMNDAATHMAGGRGSHGSVNDGSSGMEGMQPAVLDAVKPASLAAASGKEVDQGLKVRNLSDRERAAYGLSDGGVVVISVGQGAALQAGFKQGDVVLMLDGVSLTSPAQFHELMRGLPHDRPVPVLVHRPNADLFLPLSTEIRH